MAATSRPTKAQGAWVALNERQRTWLRVIYNTDQDMEEHHRGAFARGEVPISPTIWRWLEYERTRGQRRTRGRRTPRQGLLQQRLDELEVRDPGAGSTIKFLEEHGLIEVRYESSDPHANSLAIQLTKHGRATARAGGCDDTRVGRRSKRRPLTEGLWAMFADVAGARDAGYRPRYGINHPAWDKLVERGLVVRAAERLHLTDEGREHYRAEWLAYVRTYPDVNAPHPDEKDIWPAQVDQRLKRLSDACRDLEYERRAVAGEREKSVPEPTAVDQGAVPELARATALRNTRVDHAVRGHQLLVEHHQELLVLWRAATGRYLAAAAAVVTAVANGDDPVLAVSAEPVTLGLCSTLPYPKVGIVGVDKDITTARPGTSHKRGKRAPVIPEVDVTTRQAYDYARHLHMLVAGGRLTRLMLRQE